MGVFFGVEQMRKISFLQFSESKCGGHVLERHGQEIETIYKAQMQSMQYFQVHDFASIIDGFVFDVVVDAVIQNELEVITLSVMSYHSIPFVVFVDEPLTEFLYG